MNCANLGAKEKIAFKSFSKSFADLLVLDNLNFTVGERDFLCIVGPTGCGKTTLCNLITTLLSPTQGTVHINGDLADTRKHNIGFVFQEPSCLPWRTVWDDIKLGLEIKGYDQGEVNKRVTQIIELVGLKGFESYYPRQLSGGMKQRVAIARAFVTEPDLLLMDEPFGELDIKTRFFMMDEVLKLWQAIKATIIYVTHNLEEAVYLGQQIMVLSQKPTRIKAMIPVKLPHPRDYADPAFIEIRKEVTELVKWW